MRVISGNLVDILHRRIHPVELAYENGKIISIVPNTKIEAENYILPGFVDAHVHIESSMLVPSEFAKLAVVHGTVATVSDPHEIANPGKMFPGGNAPALVQHGLHPLEKAGVISRE